MHPLSHFVQGVRFQRQTHAPLAPQEIRHRRNLGTFWPLEQQRRPPRLHHPVGDLGNLENGIDLSRNALQLVLLLQRPDKVPQVSILHFPSVPSSSPSLGASSPFPSRQL